VTDEAAWPAPVAVNPIDATVSVPGSKSITNRALVLAALADEPGTIRRPLHARDTDLMVAGLRALGVKVRKNGTRGWTVTPARLRGGKPVDVGNAGTVMRFLPPVAALADGDVAFHGDERASQRPIGPVLDALRTLGVAITGDAVPCTVHGRGSVTGGEVVVDASTSSQFVSALLLVGARFDNGIVVVHDGPPVPSQPHIDMTVSMLRDVGVAVDTSTPQRWAVAPGSIEGCELDVEPDLSNAAPFLAAAMVTGGTVVIPGWPKRTTQAGDALRHLFAEMGGSCTLGSEGLTARGPEELLGIDVDLHDVGELAPVVAAVCALATSTSTLRGIAHLRLHETDRLAALAHELTALGANVEELDDGLRIDPAPLHGGTFRTYDDHRLATAAAVLGLVVPGIHIENVETTAKTMPEFVELWRAMLEGR
jgi:3-phosphoshikimate 1-carboxyvinyltransferase